MGKNVVKLLALVSVLCTVQISTTTPTTSLPFGPADVQVLARTKNSVLVEIYNPKDTVLPVGLSWTVRSIDGVFLGNTPGDQIGPAPSFPAYVNVPTVQTRTTKKQALRIVEPGRKRIFVVNVKGVEPPLTIDSEPLIPRVTIETIPLLKLPPASAKNTTCVKGQISPTTAVRVLRDYAWQPVTARNCSELGPGLYQFRTGTKYAYRNVE